MCICIYLLIFKQQLRFDVAKLCNLPNLDNQEQNDLLIAILSELESDDCWDTEDTFEKAYTKMGLKRFRLNKQMLDTMSKETKDKELMTGGKEIGKKTAMGLLQKTKGPAAEVKIKLEHEFIRPASDQLTTLNTEYKKM